MTVFLKAILLDRSFSEYALHILLYAVKEQQYRQNQVFLSFIQIFFSLETSFHLLLPVD